MINKENDYTDNGKCNVQKCYSKCCTSILPLSQIEIKTIKKYVLSRDIQPNIRTNINPDQYLDVCPFLKENFRCAIYNCAPEICKYYSCHKCNGTFSNKNKHLVNMWSTFFPEVDYPNQPDVEQLDYMYQTKKELAKH